METDLRRHLETCAATFANATNREASTVARLAAGDWRFFDRLTEGASFTARKYDVIMGWFSENWPSSHPWPTGVPRPSIPANDTASEERAA